MQYEGNPKNHGNFQAFYAGSYACFARYFIITYAGQYLLDFYHFNVGFELYYSPMNYKFPIAPVENSWEPTERELRRRRLYLQMNPLKGNPESEAVSGVPGKPLAYV